MKKALETALIATAYCFFILVFIAIVLSGIKKVTERKTKYYDDLEREYYVDIASDQTEIPRKYLGQTGFGTVAGDDL